MVLAIIAGTLSAFLVADGVWIVVLERAPRRAGWGLIMSGLSGAFLATYFLFEWTRSWAMTLVALAAFIVASAGIMMYAKETMKRRS
jgi:hypothetical protein